MYFFDTIHVTCYRKVSEQLSSNHTSQLFSGFKCTIAIIGDVFMIKRILRMLSKKLLGFYCELFTVLLFTLYYLLFYYCCELFTVLLGFSRSVECSIAKLWYDFMSYSFKFSISLPFIIFKLLYTGTPTIWCLNTHLWNRNNTLPTYLIKFIFK